LETQFQREEQFRWPISLIYKITDDVRFAKTIDRLFYPTEWLIGAAAGGQGLGGSGGAGMGHGGGAATKGGQKEPGRDNKQKGRDGNGGGAGRRQPWVDDRHPKIVAMMADYVATRGLRVQLTEILDAANKQITDLPTILEYVENGWPVVCWAHILGKCTFQNCAFCKGHDPRGNIPDKFADEVVAMLTPGVQHCARPKENNAPPGKRLKTNNQQWRELQVNAVSQTKHGERIKQTGMNTGEKEKHRTGGYDNPGKQNHNLSINETILQNKRLQEPNKIITGHVPLQGGAPGGTSHQTEKNWEGKTKRHHGRTGAPTTTAGRGTG
jgi:hypothetical protein